MQNNHNRFNILNFTVSFAPCTHLMQFSLKELKDYDKMKIRHFTHVILSFNVSFSHEVANEPIIILS